MGSIMLLMGWALAGQVAAASDADALKAEVRKLVRQLDAAQLAPRDAAEQKLLDLGPPVLELLPEVTAATPPEPAQRLGRIRQILQQRAAESAASASLVSFKAQTMPLAKILAALTQQTGNTVTLRQADQAEAALTADFDKTPFWQALDRLLDQAGLTVYSFGHSDGVQLVPRGPGHAPRAGRACYVGPFRIEPVRVTTSRDLRDPAGQSLVVGIEAAWEPRLKLIGLKQRMADVTAVDENGTALPVDDKDAVSEALVPGAAVATEFDLRFALPSRQVKEIALLKGTLQAMVPGKIETFRFGDLLKAKNAEKRIAGATVAIDEVRKNNELWEVRVRVRFDNAGDALESHRNWVLQNDAYMEGPKGEVIPYDSSAATQRGKNEIGMTYVFDLKAPPADLTFVYKTPGTIVTTRFPYELRGIKLP
jgi:hypothetical protein